MKHIWVRDGVKGYYRGLGPTIFGYIPTWAIYFSVYDGIKEHFGEGYGGTPKHLASPFHHCTSQLTESRWSTEHSATKGDATALHLSAAMVAGATGTFLTHPIWVVKTRFMASSSC